MRLHLGSMKLGKSVDIRLEATELPKIEPYSVVELDNAVYDPYILRIPLNLMELHCKGKGIAGHELIAGFDNIKILKPTGNAQYEGLISSQLRDISDNRSDKLKEEGLKENGKSLYMGSKSSDFRIVFYEKGDNDVV